MNRHPLFHARIETFVGETGALALFGSGLPYFRAATEIEAYRKADEWRDAQIAKHEAVYVRRQQAAAERKAKGSSAQAVEAGSERTAAVERPTSEGSSQGEAEEGDVTGGESAATHSPEEASEKVGGFLVPATPLSCGGTSALLSTREGAGRERRRDADVTAGETATSFEPDDGAIGGVKAQGRLPDAESVEPSSSAPSARAE